MPGLPAHDEGRRDVSGQPLLRLSQIGLQIRGQPVLNAVDLTVAERQIVTLIGPNGAGKTMLVRIALGLLTADRGTVTRHPGIAIGYMPQHLVIDDTLPLTVGRFLTLGARAPAAMAAVLAEVGIGHLTPRPVQAISGGEMQRVLLARTLLRDPDLLVLDEPAQSLDIGGQSEFYQLIADVRDRRGCGILLVSHDLHLVMAAADRVVCLNHHVCCTGRPQEVRQDPAFLALFPGAAPAGLGIYAHQHDHAHEPSGRVAPLSGEGGGAAGKVVADGQDHA